jgi:hypothetical protein
LELEGTPPTAAIGLAVMLELPPAVTALFDVELAIMPQPRLTVVLP